MITRKEFESRQFCTHGIQYEREVAALNTTHAEMDLRKEKSIWLQKLVSDRVCLFYREGNYKNMSSTYEALEYLCFIAPATMKKVLLRSHNVSREFLYKFTVGLRMGITEANKYFALCGGVLSEDNDYDYVVRNALRDSDTVESLLAEFVEYFARKL